MSIAATPTSSSAQPNSKAIPEEVLPPPIWPPKEPNGSAAQEGAAASREITTAARRTLRFIACSPPPFRDPPPLRCAGQPESARPCGHVRPSLKYYVNFSRIVGANAREVNYR